MERALAYMALTPNMPVKDIVIDKVFIGSRTNSRIEDTRSGRCAGAARTGRCARRRGPRSGQESVLSPAALLPGRRPLCAGGASLSIGRAFLTGWVSAEVPLHGKLWGVLPEQLFDRLQNPTGMVPSLQAIEVQLLTPKVARRIPALHTHDAWRVALAWLTRDQECRFNDVLDWRAAASDSESRCATCRKGASKTPCVY